MHAHESVRPIQATLETGATEVAPKTRRESSPALGPVCRCGDAALPLPVVAATAARLAVAPRLELLGAGYETPLLLVRVPLINWETPYFCLTG